MYVFMVNNLLLLRTGVLVLPHKFYNHFNLSFEKPLLILKDFSPPSYFFFDHFIKILLLLRPFWMRSISNGILDYAVCGLAVPYY